MVGLGLKWCNPNLWWWWAEPLLGTLLTNPDGSQCSPRGRRPNDPTKVFSATFSGCISIPTTFKSMFKDSAFSGCFFYKPSPTWVCWNIILLNLQSLGVQFCDFAATWQEAEACPPLWDSCPSPQALLVHSPAAALPRRQGMMFIWLPKRVQTASGGSCCRNEPSSPPREPSMTCPLADIHDVAI